MKNIKEFIINILRGMVIGLSNVIPGVSGGTMMVSMGIYDKLIMVLTHFIKKFKEAVALVLPLIIGMVLAIVLFSKLFSEVLFPKFPFQTNLFFIGLIIGSLPIMFKKVKGNKMKVGNFISFALFFALVVGFALMGEGSDNGADVSLSFVNMIKLFLAGIVCAATMVIPGVSGSMVMMIMGYYQTIIDSINGFVNALRAVDINGLIAYCGILVPFGIGAVVGVVAVAKLVEFVFNKYSQLAYWAIIGLIVASPFAIIIMMNLTSVSVVGVISGIVMLAVGFLISLKLGGE